MNQSLQTTFSGLTFPDGDHAPPVASQRPGRATVALDVFVELGAPERDVRLRVRGFGTPCVPVPEATVNEYRNTSTRQHDVRCAHDRSSMQSESQAGSMQI